MRMQAYLVYSSRYFNGNGTLKYPQDVKWSYVSLIYFCNGFLCTISYTEVNASGLGEKILLNKEVKSTLKTNWTCDRQFDSLPGGNIVREVSTLNLD